MLSGLVLFTALRRAEISSLTLSLIHIYLQQQPKTSLETFGHKHFFLFSKYLRRYPNSPIARLPGKYQEFRLFFSLQQGTLYRTCAALSSALFVRVCGGKNPQRSAALVFIGQIPVSYTHLDVYKRQALRSARALAASMAAAE